MAPKTMKVTVVTKPTVTNLDTYQHVTIDPGTKTVHMGATIHPIVQEFGNGDLNVLRDKINEIIKHK